MTKKISLLLLICILSALNISAEIYEGSCGTNVHYALDTETGILSITGTGPMTGFYFDGDAPWYSNRSYINTVNIADGVTSIGNYAFPGCSNLIAITIPSSVTSIGNFAFSSCTDLTSVTIPSSMTYISYMAFSGCYFEKKNFINNSSLDAETNNYWGATIVDSKENGFYTKDRVLIKYTGNETSVTIPNSVTSIGSSAFSGCSNLTSVEIPNGVTSIGYYAFYNCSGLTSVEIPNSVTSIGAGTFSGCSGLTYITIPNSVTSIGHSAFYGTPWYNNQPNGLIYAGKVAYAYKGTMPDNTTISIKEGTLGITGYAFSGCSGLASVEIPNSVTTIESSAFSSCSGLTSITIPNSVTSIESSAFFNCTGLTSVNIGNSVKSLGNQAFYGCTNIKNVIVNCDSIVAKKYSSGSAIKDIFGSQVKEYKIGNDVKSIGDYAFNQCEDLTSVTIGSDVKSLGDYAFANIPKLDKIYCYASNVPITTRTSFENSYLDYVTLYVPASSLDTYKSTAPWKNAASILPLEDIKEKCATPTILFENGKLSFSCETEGVKYVYNFSTPSESGDDGSNISMPEKLQVSVYAKKDGFENSDVATKEIDLGTSGIRGDLNGDGVVNMPDAMFIVNKMLKGKFPDEELEKAGLRFGFYGTIPGYFTINKIDIKGLRHDKFGTDMVGSSLGTSADMPTYDRADGSYTNVYFEDSNNNSSMNIVIEYSLDGNNYSYTYQTDLRDFKPNKNYTFIIGFTLHEIFVSYKVEDQDGPTQ